MGSDPQGTHIWVVNETGVGARDLGGATGASDSWPSWSPTGDRLAFSRFSSLPYSHEDVWVMNADGTNPVQLTGTPGGAPTGVYEAPAWSPDGTRIAYSTANTIGVMNADGANYHDITWPGGDRRFRYPAWSPDSTKLAFENILPDAGDGYGSMTNVAVINADGSGMHDLISFFEDGVVDSEPAWSPDGTEILFASNRSGTRNVWIMNSDGSGKANVTNSRFDDQGPTWSPDGSSMAFSSSRSGGSHIFTMQMRFNRLTRMFVHRWPVGTFRIATTRVGSWLVTRFSFLTDLTAGVSAVACSNPTWSAA
jgi:TolB protein